MMRCSCRIAKEFHELILEVGTSIGNPVGDDTERGEPA